MAAHDQNSPHGITPKHMPHRSPKPAAALPPPIGNPSAKSCPHCGKKFYGKPPAQCPACFLSTAGGQSDAFECADPSFVRNLAWGAVMVALSIPLHIAGVFCKLFNEPQLKGVAHAVAAVLAVLGVFMLTRRDAKFLASRRKPALWAQFSAGICAVLWLILGFIAFHGAPHLLVKALVSTAMVFQCILCGMLGSYCAYLALRVPDDSLSHASRLCGSSAAISCALLVVVQAIELTDPLFIIMLTWPFPFTEIMLILFGWSMITLLRLAVNMRACARESESLVSRRLQPRRVPKYEGKIDF